MSNDGCGDATEISGEAQPTTSRAPEVLAETEPKLREGVGCIQVRADPTRRGEWAPAQIPYFGASHLFWRLLVQYRKINRRISIHLLPPCAVLRVLLQMPRSREFRNGVCGGRTSRRNSCYAARRPPAGDAFDGLYSRHFFVNNDIGVLRCFVSLRL